ncbi:hypothetical protein SDRG_06891 [Saprolegnia diclina VS20]|uniref:Uncharacterized protein n=1 Tax=Saprolegnia diclina (strain VS20) TaxID=1156394 RepID=T0QCJ0_SAPDV|nr:hypothetical protein SDRG_06891 [Saprolegnia diclina VS20]EQC35604.1 hypothetical protein SDRG_06891 [Saprolegnia diclina VS20]|eukprot:XP_008610921.1 hypothetical protein SDRG_06891 [Saprolegnia diclina VS20]
MTATPRCVWFLLAYRSVARAWLLERSRRRDNSKRLRSQHASCRRKWHVCSSAEDVRPLVSAHCGPAYHRSWVRNIRCTRSDVAAMRCVICQLAAFSHSTTTSRMDRHGLGRLGCTGCETSVALKPIFQRNNKDKKKNIRCFPHCCNGRGGHKSAGFCGSSVFATTHVACDAAICRFESSTLDEGQRFVVGRQYASVDISSDFPVVETATTRAGRRFVINPDVNKRGWSYAYDSRIEKNRRHRMSVYFFDGGVCVDILHSTWFELRSTRMPKHKAAPHLMRPLSSPSSPLRYQRPMPQMPNVYQAHAHLRTRKRSLDDLNYYYPRENTTTYSSPRRTTSPYSDGVQHVIFKRRPEITLSSAEAAATEAAKWSVFTPKWTILPPLVAR